MIFAKEIYWEEIPYGKILLLEKRIRKETSLNEFGINFTEPNIKLLVEYDNLNFYELLDQKFSICKANDCVPMRLICISCQTALNLQIPYPNYGYVADNRKLVIIFAKSFGVFKSVISGVASLYLENESYSPMHASVISTNTTGVAFAGGCSAGKTTTLLNVADSILRINLECRILTDDWAILRKSGSHYIAHSFDRSISVTKKTLAENEHLVKIQRHELLQKLKTSKKISMLPSKMFNAKVDAMEVKIDTIIILNPTLGGNSLQKISAKDFIDVMINSAYHYPYINKDQIAHHREFWQKVFNKVRTFMFYTRNSDDSLQRFDSILQLF
ncbi:MAG: hypothetical protein ABH830_03460 [Patescibacteria group bacterium]